MSENFYMGKSDLQCEFHVIILPVAIQQLTQLQILKLTTFGMVTSVTNRLTTIMTTRHYFSILHLIFGQDICTTNRLTMATVTIMTWNSHIGLEEKCTNIYYCHNDNLFEVHKLIYVYNNM